MQANHVQRRHSTTASSSNFVVGMKHIQRRHSTTASSSNFVVGMKHTQRRHSTTASSSNFVVGMKRNYKIQMMSDDTTEGSTYRSQEWYDYNICIHR